MIKQLMKKNDDIDCSRARAVSISPALFALELPAREQQVVQAFFKSGIRYRNKVFLSRMDFCNGEFPLRKKKPKRSSKTIHS